jgi:hypothetical protein
VKKRRRGPIEKKRSGERRRLGIFDDLVKDNLPSLVLWHRAQLGQLLPRRRTDEQLGLSTGGNMHDRIRMSRVRHHELIILLGVDERLGGGSAASLGVRVGLAGRGQVHVCRHPHKVLRGGLGGVVCAC